MNTAFLDKNKSKSRLPEAVSCFIKKTYDLLEDQKFPDIVDWNAEGTAIVIKKPTEFGQKVLPTYFKHNNLTSFVRQLNMYDFHKRRTQKYDHVYYHDLFQKDKRHLLSEIRRKNQDTALANIQKAIESLEQAQGGIKQEGTSQSYENQLLKKLNKDALARISSLENKVKELTIQNQALYNQVAHQNQKEDVLVSFLANFMKKKGITLDELPKVLHNQFNVQPLMFEANKDLVAKASGELRRQNLHLREKSVLPTNVCDFFNSGEDLSNSTEISPSSPMSKDHVADYEKQNDGFLMERRDYKDEPRCKSECSNEYSVLQNKTGVDHWRAQHDFNEKIHDSFLGKRNFEVERGDLWGVQKLIKRDPFTSSNERNPFVIGELKEELDDIRVKKLDSFMDAFGSIENHNISIDLMNFS